MPGATIYSYGQLESIWLQAAKGTKYESPQWANTMAAIALAESSGNPGALNPNDNGGKQSSFGLWQISLGTHQPPAPNWNNPLENAKLAIGKLDTQGLKAWGTYDSGLYLKYLKPGTQPVSPGPMPTGGGSGSGDGTAQLTADTTPAGDNPVKFKQGEVTGQSWAGNFISGVAGAVTGDPQVTGQAVSQSGGLLGIATGVAGLAQTVSKFTQLIVYIMRPAFWLRIGAAVLAFVALGGAAYFMREAI